ncbi:MAG TPA: carbon monoxide dehydrogenase [Acidimicrobiaceae bacterium]|jgi:carbon-monoxide dehydrogenase medium subunit|nr:carbon monoxide dehydrogenase [Acidimicrobiaceae bacterium]MCH2632428.1 xanthine dehydrogenase family protein subunit M [Acidimicrobiales bacterium]OUW33000.1 MAG: carbon monoxide dehydrogenase [Actinobacteria bacterium TMED172]HAA66696.1 carbon monoxide dehydrogenase [Acidimicrobiaceae bacterium]HAY65606.1 carbon monoxide dehydrogenase [Acidimicrobiaceae bacterium]|tara:strand:+ start:7992 stop:8819 length:828 start_codon:yes stop_codon:yes gene_type:complete
MIPASFDYVKASSADEAISLISEHGDEAKLLAGGHSLIPMMKLRLAVPSVLVDIAGVRDLSHVEDRGDHIAIGALAKHRSIETSDLLIAQCPMLAHVASKVGDPQVRHRGTIGGSLAHSDPASDLPAAVLALGGSLIVQGPNGQREIAATDFFTGYFESALAEDEMLTEVKVPKSPGTNWNYQKFNRRAQDWAIVGVAAAQVDGAMQVSLVNMGSTPLRATAVETALASGASAAEAADEAANGTEAPTDLNASPEYRAHLARVLTKRALEASGVE